MVECGVKFVLRNGGVDVVRVTVSGHPGSGTSTLVRSLCEVKGWSSINGGDIFREEARRRNLSLEAFSKLCIDDEKIDLDLDQELQRRMTMENGPEVVESRLAGWWAHRLDIDCVRIWLEVNEDERAIRVVNREGGNIDTQRAKGIERMEADAARYLRLYGIDMDSREPYDCVIDGTNQRADEVLAATISYLEDK